MFEVLYLFPDTHALVQFLDEDAIAVVPITRLKEQEYLKHEVCPLLQGVINSTKLFFYCNYTLDGN